MYNYDENPIMKYTVVIQKEHRKCLVKGVYLLPNYQEPKCPVDTPAVILKESNVTQPDNHMWEVITYSGQVYLLTFREMQLYYRLNNSFVEDVLGMRRNKASIEYIAKVTYGCPLDRMKIVANGINKNLFKRAVL